MHVAVRYLDKGGSQHGQSSCGWKLEDKACGNTVLRGVWGIFKKKIKPQCFLWCLEILGQC